MGGSAVAGSLLRTVFTLSRTSCVATSGSFERSKAMVIEERPVLEEERNSSMPVAVLTAPSRTSVTSVSISAGAAPVLVVVTETVGMSIFGKRSTPSVKNENPPMTVSTRLMTVAKTGRLTQISANFCITQNLDLQSELVADIALCPSVNSSVPSVVKKALLNHKGHRGIHEGHKGKLHF